MKFTLDAKTVLYAIANILIFVALFKIFKLSKVIIYVLCVVLITALPFITLSKEQRKKHNFLLAIFLCICGVLLSITLFY